MMNAYQPTVHQTTGQPKIGVLTFHRCINYGSYWQARSLVEALCERGYAAEILEHVSPRVNRAEWRCALQPVLPTPTPRSDYPLYARKVRKFFAAFDTLPCSSCFELENPAAMDEYDLVIVGSDEVWNLSHPWYGGCPLFYGEGIRARRLASYAASFGNYDASQPLHPAWRERLRAFDWISVRDENSRQIIQRELGIDPEFVLDPCLLYPTTVQQDADEDAPRLGANYVAVYGHNFPAHTIQAVRTWAQARGYPLVSIGYRNDWADQQWIAAGPAEFAHFMQDAVAVITNFFHGCVFALLNEKPFVCGLSDYRAHKIHDLMAAIGGERHLLAEDAPQIAYADCLDEPLDPAILHRIEMLRCTSHQFLGRVLLEALPEAVPA